MIYENVELFNVDQLADGDGGKRMMRIPENVRVGLNGWARDKAAFTTTGVEVRFVMNGDKAVLRLYIPTGGEFKFMPLQLYYGGIQAGWVWLDLLNLHEGLNEVTVEKPKAMDKLIEKTSEDGYAFDCRVMRLLIPGSYAEFIGVEGDVRPPEQSEVPQKSVMFYGSSITHGSLSMLQSNSFVNLIGDALNANVYNKGFSGSCHVEYAMSDYLASRGDCDFLVAEVGTNVFRVIPDEELAKRIDYLIKTYTGANPGKKLFVIDNLIMKERNEECRTLVKGCVDSAGSDDVVYINGWDLIESRRHVAADFTHPTAIGQMCIAGNLLKIIRRNTEK